MLKFKKLLKIIYFNMEPRLYTGFVGIASLKCCMHVWRVPLNTRYLFTYLVTKVRRFVTRVILLRIEHYRCCSLETTYWSNIGLICPRIRRVSIHERNEKYDGIRLHGVAELQNACWETSLKNNALRRGSFHYTTLKAHCSLPAGNNST